MRLPYLQVDQDAWTRARTLAGLLGCSRREALGLLLDLWLWALEMSPDDLVDGVFQDPDPGELLASALEWTGARPTLLTGLVRVGAVVLITDGFRVRGLARYGSVLETRQKEAARKAAARAAKLLELTGQNEDVRRTSAGHLAESTRQTQTQTQTQLEATSLAPPPASPKLRVAKSEKAPDPRHAPLRAQLVETFQAITGVAYGFGPRDAKAVTDLLAFGDDTGEVVRRWDAGLRAVGWLHCATLPDLARKWNEHAPGLARQPAAKGRASNADRDWTAPVKTDGKGNMIL